jgi:hypothetical protein
MNLALQEDQGTCLRDYVTAEFGKEKVDHVYVNPQGIC